MDRYQKVEKPKIETPIDENEIRITSQGRMRSYITYALTLLQEKGSDDIVFKAMGRAINKTVTIVELIKRRIVGLHQITVIQSTDITDTWEPLEEGLQTLETTRKVSMVTITLSKKELDKTNVGYQPPIPADQMGLLLPEEEVEVEEEGEGQDPNLVMVLHLGSMKMEGMREIVGMGGVVGEEVGPATSVGVGGEAMVVLLPRWKMLRPTIKMHLEDVAVEGVFEAGVVDSDLMGQSKLLLELLRMPFVMIVD
ncbi:alba DNA/RNA-binding protein [Striga asiatica]|uniref:Alba DNA/RNA-binding protein n=1 Tax=Striga asiatica TaxID=4170 RepID=A0A5A7PDU1_STRAF|nr:alba DNA/RNA-binding protein [Striga asiatica]